MAIIRKTCRKALKDKRGTALTEFAIIAPTFFLMLMGIFDLAMAQYVKSILEGEVQKAGRDSSLQLGGLTTSQTNIDTRVRTRVQAVAKQANVTFSRRAFQRYSSVSSVREDFIDSNSNGTCNAGETYTDWNDSGTWDLIGGSSGQGGAKDAVVYTATTSYRRLFPLYSMIGWPEDQVLSSTTILVNQPFADQKTPVSRTCT
jgi:Flp pilus assembly protein TadG